MVLVEDSKTYKQWCNLFLRRTIGSKLVKMATALRRIGKGPDKSCVDHCWRASTLESYEDLSITRCSSSYWYMTSIPLLIYMFILFGCNHQGVPRVLYFGSLV